MAERSIRLRGSAVLAMTLASGCGGADTSSTAVSGICRVYASSVTATTTTSFTGMSSTAAGIRFRSMVAASAGADNIYTTWDVAGRPTAYQFPDGFGAMVHLSYDDSARTRTTVNGGGSSGSITTVAAFDANGNLVRSVTTSRIPPPPISGGNEFVETEDTRFVIGATMRVCR